MISKLRSFREDQRRKNRGDRGVAGESTPKTRGVITVVFVVVGATSVLLASTWTPLAADEPAKWPVAKIAKMARVAEMAAIVVHLTNDGAYDSEQRRCPRFTLETRVDMAALEDVRAAILMKTNGNTRKGKILAAFARTDNAAATCSTVGTAGEDGLDACVAQCERKQFSPSRSPPEGACHVLCSLAVAPCRRKSFLRKVWSKTFVPMRTLQKSAVAVSAQHIKGVRNKTSAGLQAVSTLWRSAVVNAIDNLVTNKLWPACPDKAEGTKAIRSLWGSAIKHMAKAYIMAYVTRDAEWHVHQTVRVLLVVLVLGSLVLLLIVQCCRTAAKSKAFKDYKVEMEGELEATQREIAVLKTSSLFEVRRKLTQRKGSTALHELEVWEVYFDSCREKGCRLLFGFLSKREKRIMVTKLAWWRAVVAPTEDNVAQDAGSAQARP